METQSIYVIIALVIYFGILVYSLISTREYKYDLDSFARGKGSYQFFFIAVVMAVTMVGPADALALSQNGLKYGAIWAIFPIGAALAQFVSGTFFTGRIKESFGKIDTIGDIFSERCDKSSTAAAGFIAFIQAIAFSGVLILAGGQVLETFMGLQKEIGMIITAILVGGYTSYRGMVAVMRTDIFQGILMGLMIIVLLIAVIILSINSDFHFWNDVVKKTSFNTDYDINLILTMFLGYFLGELLLPTYCIRASISKDSASASRGFKLASLILVFWYLLITYSGSLGQFINENIKSATDELILVDVVNTLSNGNQIFSNILGAFVFLVFLSLIHSTFDSFLNTGALSFGKDLFGKYLKLKDSQQLWLSKQATIGISLLGLLIALWKNDLIDILFIGYTVWVPTILASLLWILLHKDKKLHPKAFWIGLFIGILAWFIFEYLYVIILPSILIGLILNYITITLIQKRIVNT